MHTLNQDMPAANEVRVELRHVGIQRRLRKRNRVDTSQSLRVHRQLRYMEINTPATTHKKKPSVSETHTSELNKKRDLNIFKIKLN